VHRLVDVRVNLRLRTADAGGDELNQLVEVVDLIGQVRELAVANDVTKSRTGAAHDGPG
jgi:hypothetical protein